MHCLNAAFFAHMTPADEPNPTETSAPAHHTTDESAHPDPITGEPGAHPLGVGIGAIGAGIAGATIGLVAGPIGAAIGAAIGAVAGGLAGKEVAAVDDETPSPAEPALSAASASGFDSTGVPVASLTASPETDVAGSNIGDSDGITAGQFHDAFTATTLHETEVENRLLGDDAPNDAPVQERSTGSSAFENTPFDFAAERSEHIRTAAYFRFLERLRQGLPGNELDDWTAAERNVHGG